jgi:hypothetical protein
MAIGAGFVVRVLPLTITAVASAQTAGWQPVATPAPPPARQDHALAYDAMRQFTVLFGGWSALGHHADTWEWDGAAWAQRSPPASPTPRYAHAMAYDAARQEVVLFGGMGTGAAQLSDTWVWNGTTWTQRTPLVSPSARYNHAMAYDEARQRVVLFGGAFGLGAGVLADTWEWNGVGWTPRSTSGQPLARKFHAMAYDAGRQRVVLFGGNIGLFSAFPDTWEWDGAAWTEIPAPAPGRDEHAMAWAGGLQGTLVFGGRTTQPQVTDVADTRFWNGTAWTPVATPPSPSPQPRSRHALAWHAATGQVLLFGGCTTQGAFQSQWGDTWVFTGTFATGTPYGDACGVPPLALAQVAQARPILGQTAIVRLATAPTPAIALAIGWSNTTLGTTPLPLSLAGLGMTGCSLHQSADLLGLAFAASGTGFGGAVALPNAASLLGGHAYLQAVAFAPGQNPAQLTTSNGVAWRFGNL